MPRLFTTAQRAALRIASGDYCAECGVEIDASFHADHVTPHAHGGATEIDNGQALCPACNISKSDNPADRRSAPPLPRVPTATAFTPYRWQQRLLDQVIASGDGISAISLNACVGAGKTPTLTHIYQQHLAARFRRPLFIVAVPMLNLLDGWQRSFDRANLNFAQSVDVATTRDIEAGRIHGIGLTYASIQRKPEIINALCCRFDVVLVRDECQWISDANDWGATFIEATAHAAFHIGATGTPFRTADDELVWGWSGDADTVLAFDYDYHEALADRVVPELVWTAVGGTIDWVTERDGTKHSRVSRFGEDEELTRNGTFQAEGLINERLRFAVHADGNVVSTFLVELLNMADKRLAKIRRHQRNAGGIIFAQSIAAAEVIAMLLRNRGRSAVVVTSETPGARERIKDFTESKSEWIVSVDMLKEGTDIPRLRVGVIANNCTAKRFIDQEVGRLLRLFRLLGWDEQRVEMFIPRDPRLVAAMVKFGEDIGLKRQKRDGGGGGGGGGRYTLLSVQSDDVATDLVGTIGTAGTPPRNFGRLKVPYEASGFAVPFADLRVPQVRALLDAVAGVGEIGISVLGALSVTEYVAERNGLASILADRTGFERKACRVFVDRLMRPHASAHRVGALAFGEDA